MKKYLVICFLFCAHLSVYSQDMVDRINEKSRLTRENILKKDEERRERILRKFDEFQKKVENFAPGFKLDMPVNADIAEDINNQKLVPAVKKGGEIYAYAADSYKLKSLPYDSVKETTAGVIRGDRVAVLMKPDIPKKSEYSSLTKDWFLVRTSSGAEGYIPQNLLLNKKPAKKRTRPVSLEYNQESDLPSGMLLPGFVTAGYGQDSGDATGSMKVNTSVLKIRSEPAFNGDVVGSLYKNDIVEVIEYSSNYDNYEGHTARWAKVKKDDVTGWVFSYYLVPSSGGGGSSASSDFTSYLAKDAELYVKSDILRVRDAPDDLGSVLFSLQNKDSVRVIDLEPDEVTLGGKKSKWVKIRFLDYEGWVFGAFLSGNRNAIEEGDDINSIFQAPISEGSYFISSKFGKRILQGKVSNHTGVDLAAPCGTPVMAAADGTVILVSYENRNCGSCGYGNHVIIEHRNGYRTVYGHLTSIAVKNGQKLNSGANVGTVGNTGHSFGCHLHFEVRANEEFVDPLNYIHP